MIPTTTVNGHVAGAYKHLQVREYLEELIADELRVGDLIPSERFLTHRFGISRMTVRQAIDGLVSEGVLRREHGRGTFVADRVHSEFELRLTTFGEEMRHRGLVPGSRALVVECLQAPRWLADALAIDPGALVHHFERLRTADGLPVSLEESWIPVSLAPELLDHGVPPSLYDALRAAELPPTWGRTPSRPGSRPTAKPSSSMSPCLTRCCAPGASPSAVTPPSCSVRTALVATDTRSSCRCANPNLRSCRAPDARTPPPMSAGRPHPEER
nr:GntR family transcriptional regulator [Xylanimonas allomyrinae]